MIDVKKIKNFRNLGAVVLSAGIIGTFCSCSKENNTKIESGSLISQYANNDISSVEYHSPENIKNRGELVVAVDASGNFDFCKDENGNKLGLSVNLSKEIAKEICEDVEVKFVEINDGVGDITEGLLNKVEKGEVDIAMSMAYINDDSNIKDLKNRFTLSKAYLDYDIMLENKVEIISIYAKNDEVAQYTSQKSLFDKKIAVVKNSVAHNMISNFASRAEIIYCENINECIEKVLNGEVDLVGAEDNDELNKILNSITNISKCSVTVPENLEDLGCFIAMMKNNENLKNLINKVIKEKKESGDVKEWLYGIFSKELIINSRG